MDDPLLQLWEENAEKRKFAWRPAEPNTWSVQIVTSDLISELGFQMSLAIKLRKKRVLTVIFKTTLDYYLDNPVKQ